MTISKENLSHWTWHVSHVSRVLGNIACTSINNFGCTWMASVLTLSDDKESVDYEVEYAFWLDMSDKGEITASIRDGFRDDDKFYQLVGYCHHHDIPLKFI